MIRNEYFNRDGDVDYLKLKQEAGARNIKKTRRVTCVVKLCMRSPVRCVRKPSPAAEEHPRGRVLARQRQPAYWGHACLEPPRISAAIGRKRQLQNMWQEMRTSANESSARASQQLWPRTVTQRAHLSMCSNLFDRSFILMSLKNMVCFRKTSPQENFKPEPFVTGPATA